MATPPRAVVARLLHRVIKGESLNHILPKGLEEAAERDKPLCKELLLGSLREWPFLLGVCRHLLHKPIRTKDRDLLAAICCGLYELRRMRTPPHATVSEWVNTTQFLKKPWAAALVNSVLRQFQREASHATSGLSQAEYAALPSWLYTIVSKEYGYAVADFAEASRGHPPMFLRVNQNRISRDNYLALLDAENLEAFASPLSENAVHLTKPVGVDLLPGFTKGIVSIQDLSAQLSASLLRPRQGERILDACSAPGSKACHLLETEPNLKELVACDISKTRLGKVEENRHRLGLSMKIKRADARKLPMSLSSNLFDAVLADVPCSATGVLRRNPDAKLLRQREDVAEFAKKQLSILEGLWPVVKPGGRLLYVTCSILDAENDCVVEKFIQTQKAEVTAVNSTHGITRRYGRQYLPNVNGGDGLYYSLLKKPAR